MSNFKSYYLLLLLPWLPFSARAQTVASLIYDQPVTARPPDKSVQSVSLEEALISLEVKYNVSIVYKSELVQNKTTKTFKLQPSLDETLEQLLKPHKLQFKKSKNEYVIIRQEGQPASIKEVMFQQLRHETPQLRYETPLMRQEMPSRQSLAAITITGKITDENAQALPGVTVLLKGTTVGTTSDVDGRYSLNVPDGNGTLVASYIGYTTLEIPVNNRTVINFSLAPDVKALEEVIVVGYGTQKKSDLTGSVGTIKAETLQERPAASLNQGLAGRITGVNVSVNSGRPGGRANIRIRGNTSVSVTNNPLYVIDGVILNVTSLTNGSTPIDYINPNDIASIEVLKDASATAIYGARGANGVILVTTKRGSQGGGRATYDSDYSIGVLPRKIPLLNSREFLLVEEQAYANAEKYDPVGWAGGKYTDPKTKRTNPLLFDSNGNPLYDTDWQKEAFQKAFTQNHQLSFTGGNGKDSYGAYMGYRNENGLVKNSWLKRYAGRFVMDTQIKDWLKVGGTISYNDQSESQVDPLGAGGIIAMRQVLEALPIIPIKYPDGRWGGNEDYPGMEGGGNPLHVLTERLFYVKTQTMLGNIYANIKLAEGLDLRSTVGTNIINQRIDYYGGNIIRINIIYGCTAIGQAGYIQNHSINHI